jgi:hypothetical protein
MNTARPTSSCPLERGHWVRPTVNTYAPTRIIVLTADYDSVIGSDYGEVCLRKWVCVEVRRRGMKWSATNEVIGGTEKGLWNHLRDRGHKSPRLYIMCEDGAAALAPLGFWAEVKAKRLSLQLSDDESEAETRPLPLVMNDKCDIVGARWQHGNLRIVAPKNYGLEDLERKLTPRSTDEENNAVDRAHQLLVKMQKMIEWWITLECGPWADTSAGLGFSWWKSTIKPQTVLVHDNEECHKLECESVYGGRIQSFFHGRVRTPGYVPGRELNEPKPLRPVTLSTELFHLDVRSMYVSLMRDRQFPTRILGKLDVCTPAVLAQVIKGQGVIAQCRIRVELPSVPFRHEKGILWPSGEWDCVLTTPEIALLLRQDAILEVFGGWRYQMGVPLERYAIEVLRMRELAGICNCPVGETLAKATGNAMSGRLARRRARWVNDSKFDHVRDWGEFDFYPDETSAPTKCRAIAGRGQRFDPDGKRVAGLTAIYSHLTAYGRVRAHELLQIAGPRGCVAWDTDGGWFTSIGFNRLRDAGQIGESIPGMLRLKAMAKAGSWRTPKHHWIDGEYTLSGIPSGFAVDRYGLVKWHVQNSPATRAIDPETQPTTINPMTADFDSFHGTVPIDKDGWSSALVNDHGSVRLLGSGRAIG